MKKSLLGYGLLVISMLTLSGYKVYAQKIKSLEGQSIKELKVKTPDDTKFLIGKEYKIGIVAVLADGTELPTKGYLDGKIKWKEYTVTVNGGTFETRGAINSDGFVLITDNPKELTNHKISVTVASTYFPDSKFTSEFQVSYAVNKSIALYGPQGTSAPSKSSGGLRAYGERGERGGNGGQGGRGPSVEVFVKTIKDPQGKDLLEITYSSSKGSGYYLIDPNGGSIVIDAAGGQGGSGGSGTSGNSGGEANNRLMPSGDGGDGGNGGNGGEGGSVTFYIDPSAEKYKASLIGKTSGGDGGYAGSGGSPGSTRSTFTNEKTKYGVDQIPSGSKGRDGQKGLNGPNGPDPMYIIKKLDGTVSQSTTTATTTAANTTTKTTTPTSTEVKPVVAAVEKKPTPTPTTSTTKAPTTTASAGVVKPFQEKYDNGKIKTTGQHKNGDKTGVWKDFDENGKLVSKTEYGPEESTYTTTLYNETGKPTSISTYVKGLKSGVWKEFNSETGLPTLESTYSNDQLNGLQKVYDTDSGKLKMEGNYKADAQEGDWKVYNESGAVEQTIKYKNGEVVE